MDKINLQVIRESFGRVAYSHKTHEKSAEIEKEKVKKTKWANIFLTFTTFLSFSATVIFPTENWLLYLSIVISATTLAYNLFLFSFNSEKLAEKHRYIAKELWYIREKYVNLIADIMNERINENDIILRRDGFIKELKIIYKFAPQTLPEAYGEAGNALKKNEELTFSNKEINNFLPEDLHLNE